MHRYKFIFLISSMLFSLYTSAQVRIDTTNSAPIDNFQYSLSSYIQLDSILIYGKNESLNIKDFIQLMKDDKSFNDAFYRLRSHPHLLDHKIYFYNNRNEMIASYNGLHSQHNLNNCRYMTILKKKISGKYYKNDNYKYITASLFDKLFYTKDTICINSQKNQYSQNKSQINKRIHQLKTLVFNPGSPIDIPFIGAKLKIFSKEMSPYYNMTVHEQYYQDTIPCYVFKLSLKNSYLNDDDKTIIKYLHSYISKKDLHILSRKYKLKSDNILFDLDVIMDIQLLKKGDIYLPAYISYKGNWDIIGKKREHCNFEAYFKY